MSTNQTASELDFLRAKVATLEQLLNAYENTVSGHARRNDAKGDRIKTHASMLGPLAFATDPMVDTGDFFRSLVYSLAAITGAKYVVAGELAGDDPIRIDTLAVWGATDFIDNFSYDLSTTPCQNLLHQRRFVLETGTRDRFPQASVLAEWKAEGYVGAPIYGTTGRPLGVLTVVHDQPLKLPAELQSMVTLFAARAGTELERRRTEQALRESEARYRDLVENVLDVIFTLSPAGTIDSLNSAFVRATGWPVEEWIGKPFAPLVHPDDLPLALDIHQRVMSGEVPPTFCVRIATSRGDYVVKEITVGPNYRNGSVINALGVAREVTERHKADQIFKALVRGTSRTTGVEFFRALVYELATALEVKYAFVTELLPGEPRRLNVVASWEDGQWGQGFDYLLEGSPSEIASRNGEAFYRTGVQRLFPHNTHLARLGADSYIGVKVTGCNGDPLGLVFALDARPMERVESVRSILAIFAERAGTELERMRTELALRQSEERYARATAAGKVGVWELDVERQYYHSGSSLKALFGYAEDELGTEPADWLNLVHPDDRSIATGEWQAVMTGERESYHCELRMLHKSGRVLWTEVRGNAIRHADGHLTSLIGSTVDITERKQTEERLRESEGRYRLIFEASPDPLLIVGFDGIVRDGNPAASRAYGYGQDDLISLATSRLTDPGSLPHFDRALKTVRTGQSFTTEGMHVRRDSSRFPVDLHISPFQYMGEPVMLCSVRDITERKELEWRLQESINRFDVAVHGSQDGLWDGRFLPGLRWHDPQTPVWWSPRTRELLGFSSDEFPDVLGSWLPLIHPDDKDRVFAAMNAHMQYKVPYDIEYRLFTRFGECRWHRAKGQAAWDEYGNPVRMSGSTSDITERKLAEEALRESEERYRTLIELSPCGVLVNCNERIAYINQAGLAILGAETSSQMLDRSPFDIVTPDDQDMVRARIRRMFETGESLHRLARTYIRLDGTVVDVEVEAALMTWNGRPAIQVIFSDITERKRAEEELRRSHAFVRQIIDTDPNFIFAKDREGRFTLVNKAIADCYGTTVDELIGKTDADFNPNREEVAFFRQQDLEVMDTLTDRFIPEEIITDSAGNRRWLQTVKRPMLDEYGRAIQVVGAASDITARKHVEEALRQREHDLQAALQERERISQELHDGILQSLYAVGLGLETCKSMLGRNPRKAVRTLERAVTQLNALMREVRNFIAGLESELLQGGDLVEALRTVVQSIAFSHGLPFRVAIDRKAARHITREQSLHILNIVREAVSNSLRHAKASCGYVSLRLLKQSVRVTIRDNGIGFIPDRAVGLGHGLHNMAARAKRIGGHLTVDSKPKKGTRILFDLPKEHPHAHA